MWVAGGIAGNWLGCRLAAERFEEHLGRAPAPLGTLENPQLATNSSKYMFF
jgi:hypothetical protein